MTWQHLRGKLCVSDTYIGKGHFSASFASSDTERHGSLEITRGHREDGAACQKGGMQSQQRGPELLLHRRPRASCVCRPSLSPLGWSLV